VVIEVISPESEHRDHVTKPTLFLELPSVEAYLALRPDRDEVRVWRRDAPEPQVRTSGDVEVHGVAVPLRELYRGLHRLSRLNQTPPPTPV
jgi:Uma2 family endonuclease